MRGAPGESLPFPIASHHTREILMVLDRVRSQWPFSRGELRSVRRGAIVAAAAELGVHPETVGDACRGQQALTMAQFDELVWNWLAGEPRALALHLRYYARPFDRPHSDLDAIR